MIEYLYNAIRATAGEQIIITAKITDEEGNNVTSNCFFRLYDNDNLLTKIAGEYIGGIWQFTIPAEATANLNGRYWYCLCNGSNTFNFKQPMYLI